MCINRLKLNSNSCVFTEGFLIGISTAFTAAWIWSDWRIQKDRDAAVATMRKLHALARTS